jgi:hypothetical protein
MTETIKETSHELALSQRTEETIQRQYHLYERKRK